MAKLILSTIHLAELTETLRAIVREELQQQKAADQQEKLLTARETADLLRVSLVTLWDWEKQGRVKKYRKGGRVFFKYSEIMGSLETLQRYKKPQPGRAVV